MFVHGGEEEVDLAPGFVEGEEEEDEEDGTV